MDGHIYLNIPFNVVFFNLSIITLNENNIKIIKFLCTNESFNTFLIFSNKDER